jgi:uncharacterized protein YcbK (DUF882 family)
VRPDGAFSAWRRQQNLEIGDAIPALLLSCQAKKALASQVHLISAYLEVLPTGNRSLTKNN